MIELSICKINLGLNILERRADGFHQIETVMYPVGKLTDVVEVQKSSDEQTTFTSSGLAVECLPEQNLCMKAFRLMERIYAVGPARIHLHKNIPTGAGLGGGSANATAVIKLVNQLWELGLSSIDMEGLAAQIGSDTPFFVENRAVFARGRGEQLSPCSVDLSGYHLLLVKPDIGVSTSEAYRGVVPRYPKVSLSEVISLPMERWREMLHNDFEESVFGKLPLLEQIKKQLYDHGACYSALSGSGSTVFGLFEKRPEITFDHFTHYEKL